MRGRMHLYVCNQYCVLHVLGWILFQPQSVRCEKVVSDDVSFDMASVILCLCDTLQILMLGVQYDTILASVVFKPSSHARNFNPEGSPG